MNKTPLFALVAVLTSLCFLEAQTTQSSGEEPPPPPRGSSDQEPAGDHPLPPRNPLVEVLDKNHDHILDKAEIEAAPESLRALDRDGDGQLSGEEIRPPRRRGDSDTKGDGDSMSRSEQRRMEREQRREERQSGGQQQGNLSGQGQHRGPPPRP